MLKLNRLNKKERRIFYISPFLPNEEKFKKHYSPAAQAKVGYIRSKLKNYNNITICVNCSLTVDNTLFWTETVTDEYGKCKVLFSISSLYRLFLPISGMVMLLSVFFYILFHVSKCDVVILYHSIYYDSIVTFLKKIKKFKIIYEIEEVYADVRDEGIGREKEIERCEMAADAFIFSTEMLDEMINIYHKICIIIYGVYSYKSRTKSDISDNKKTIIVYSGTLMVGKGASQAVECAKLLDSSYEIRIIGYGSDEEKKTIKQMISESKSDCKVVFDGMKYGDEYIDYLNDCDIGLCIQPDDCRFNATSFPSKILNYLNCGLKVVASNMEALKKSKIAKLISYSGSCSPEDVAIAIKNSERMEKPDPRLLAKLDEEVEEGIYRIINVCLK